MATYSKRLLSGSTNGKQIKVAATVTPGTTIHTAVAGTSDLDEIWIYAVNTGTSLVALTLEWGETSSPDGLVVVNVPGQGGYVLVVPGLLLQNELVVRAFATTADVLMINGFVNRITS